MSIVTLPNLGPDPFTVNASVLNGKVDPLATDYNGNIQNVNIASGAGIVYSKLSLTGGIVNADVNASAAIVDTKLAQITTAGKVSVSALTVGSQAQGDVIYASSDTAWARLGAGTAGKFLRTGGAAANPAWSTNFPIEGYSTGISVLRCFQISVVAGGTPGTNITITTSDTYNAPTITGATNLAKTGSGGSFALNAGGTVITMDITENVIAVLGCFFITHKVKNSSTSAGDIFYPSVLAVDNTLTLGVKQTGTTSLADILTVLTTANDTLIFQIITIMSS